MTRCWRAQATAACLAAGCCCPLCAAGAAPAWLRRRGRRQGSGHALSRVQFCVRSAPLTYDAPNPTEVQIVQCKPF